jgi:hypothetical protein
MSIPHATFSIEILQVELGKSKTDSKVTISGCRDCLIRAMTNAILTMPEVKKILELAINNAAVRQAGEDVPIEKLNFN